MTWPLEPVGIRAFARGLEDILVVEEKHGFIEGQMKELLYNFDFGLDGGRRPSIVGKHDEAGEWILPSTGELTPATIAGVIARRIRKGIAMAAADAAHLEQVLRWMQEKDGALALPRAKFTRVPNHYSCRPPHTPTVVPAGPRALAGLAAHPMVTWR